jgi:hypothetical protein
MRKMRSLVVFAFIAAVILASFCFSPVPGHASSLLQWQSPCRGM